MGRIRPDIKGAQHGRGRIRKGLVMIFSAAKHFGGRLWPVGRPIRFNHSRLRWKQPALPSFSFAPGGGFIAKHCKRFFN
jgi:hypothetical protein